MDGESKRGAKLAEAERLLIVVAPTSTACKTDMTVVSPWDRTEGERDLRMTMSKPIPSAAKIGIGKESGWINRRQVRVRWESVSNPYHRILK